jgi:hypothetical protein
MNRSRNVDVSSLYIRNVLNFQRGVANISEIGFDILWKTVRVSISSTFRDMHAEPDYLMRFVFPELCKQCAERQLDLVDMNPRWGMAR